MKLAADGSRRWSRSRAWCLVAPVVLVALIIISAGVACDDESDADTRSSPDATATPEPTATPVQFSDSVDSGPLLVGVDILPGTYRTRDDSDRCSWGRLGGLGGARADVISLRLAEGPQVVTIAETDVAFQSGGCGTWTRDLSAITSSSTGPFGGSGTYMVGVDISPGAWRASDNGPPRPCYWARLSGFSGEPDSIIDEGYIGNYATITIAPSDQGFIIRHCRTWSRIN